VNQYVSVSPADLPDARRYVSDVHPGGKSGGQSDVSTSIATGLEDGASLFFCFMFGAYLFLPAGCFSFLFCLLNKIYSTFVGMSFRCLYDCYSQYLRFPGQLDANLSQKLLSKDVGNANKVVGRGFRLDFDITK